jgi:hypothetical protein
MGLAFSCAGVTYGAVSSTDCPVAIAAADFVELPCSDSVGNFQLLSLQTSAPMTLRVGAAGATLLGAGASYPTGFSGGEAFGFVIDGTTVAGSFTAGAQTLGDVVGELNQAAVGAGLTYLPFTSDVSGQVRVTGAETGEDGSVSVSVAQAGIGFPSTSASAVGSGDDTAISGLYLVQFDPTSAPTRIQVKGNGNIEVLAAGNAPS